MLIRALCEYHDILEKAGELLPEGYSKVKIHYLVALDEQGDIQRIIDCQRRETIRTKNGEKERRAPRECEMPKRTEKPGIDPNVVEHRPLYLFGLNYDKKEGILTPDDNTQKAKKSHECCVRANLEFLEGLDSPLIRAFRLFLQRWDPAKEAGNPYLMGLGRDYAQSGFAFCLADEPEHLLQDEPQVRERWEMRFGDDEEEGDVFVSQCAISGEQEPIARIHGKIRGVADGLPTGCVLVGYNNPSECSYGNEQAFNSGISVRMMEKYTKTLNYLLGNPEHTVVMDGVTVVFWAMDMGTNCEALMRNWIWDPPDDLDAEDTRKLLKTEWERALRGEVSWGDFKAQEKIDEDVDFYIVGLKPNSSRISVKFIYRRKFGEILENVARFQQELQISKECYPVSMARIRRELLSPHSTNEKVNPMMFAKLFDAAMYGGKYPTALLQTMVRRVRTDTDIYINRVRAGVIKACINRNYQEEAIKVSLDKKYRGEAYLCGRLFAILEKLQQDASGNSLNRTIRDAYFSSAASRPVSVYPKLVRLAQAHLKQVRQRDVKHAAYFEENMREIMDGLEHGFPDNLSLREQGEFIVGYYQQSHRTDWELGKSGTQDSEEE